MPDEIASPRPSLPRLDDDALALLFTEARTYSRWTDRPVDDATLHALHELFVLGPTSANQLPARVVYVRSDAAKAKLRDTLSPGNVDKTMAAPVTAILGYDVEFWRDLPRLFPHADMASMFRDKPAAAETSAFRNASLQGGYFILAARALGLDCGPMSGFSADKVNAAFFAGTSVKVNFLCNLGYGEPGSPHPRGPRYGFDEISRIE